MNQTILGNVVVLYTFSKEGNDAIYQKKVDELKNLLPKEIYELEDQSSILIKSRCDINELETKLRNKYEGNLKDKEAIISISIQGESLRCMNIQSSSIEDDISKELDRLQSKDINGISESVKFIVDMMRESTKQVFENILK